MTYRFLVDFPPTRWKKGDSIIVDSPIGDSEYALMLHTGVIEEVKENEPWKPITDEQYWAVDRGGDVFHIQWLDDKIDNQRHAFGNCFPTKEAAEAARDRVEKALKNNND